MLKPTRPLYLAQSFQELNKLVTNQSKGKKLAQLYRASDTLAQNVFDTNRALPVDEEKLYILAMRYINLIQRIRVEVQDERFFSTRFASTLKKVEEVKSEVLKSLLLRYEMNQTVISDKEMGKPGLIDGESTKTNKSNVIKENDDYVTSHQLYTLMNDKSIKLLIMDARSSGEYEQCALKYPNIICIPEEIIHKGLSTNTLQQKLTHSTSSIFKTRHDFDYIVLTDLDTNKISYPTTKLHDLRTILIEWDPEQRYQTLPLILEGGVRGMADNYPTLLSNPCCIFNQLFHQFDDLMQDDIEYPDVQMLETPVTPPRHYAQRNQQDQDHQETHIIQEDVLEDLEDITAGDKDNIHAVAQRLLTLCGDQVQLEDKLLKLTRKRLETKRNTLMGTCSKGDAQVTLDDISKDISRAESYRLELEVRRTLIRKDFDEKSKSQDVSYLDYIIKDVMALEKKQLFQYQKRKLVEQEESEFDKNLSKPGEPKYDARTKPSRGLPVPDRSTKPQSVNTLELELNALMANYPNSGVTGQVNIKNTCYMNSLLQCLRFCPSVAYFFTMRSFSSVYNLTCSLSELMKKLWSETRVAIRPHNFYNECCKLTSRDYSTGEHEDIHEFFLNLTNAMHKEMAEPLESAGDCTSYLADWHKHFKSKISFIKRTFFYQLEVTTSCARCKSRIVKYEYDNNVFLSMDYDQQRPIHVQNEVDKLIYPSKDPSATKYCSKCEVEMSIAHRITYYPNVLVVNIMRYTYSIREKCVLRSLNEAYFPMELSFGSVRYNLSAIACHSGNRDRGHYTACCYHPTAQKWIDYNDETCSVANVQDPIYRVRAFLLFYSLATQYDGINRQFFH